MRSTPGDDAWLTALGAPMRNCIRRYVAGGAITLDTGAIIAVVDYTGRATDVIQVDDRRLVVNGKDEDELPTGRP